MGDKAETKPTKERCQTADGWLIDFWLHENRLSLSFEFYTPQDNPEDDECSYRGFLKWDGCFNWETNPDCMAHFCSVSETDQLRRAFEKVQELARTRVKSWCGRD